MKSALIIYGGWEGHDPDRTSMYMKKMLEENSYLVQREKELTILDDQEALSSFDLIIMHWTRGELTDKQYENIQQAVSESTGLAGIHGGLVSAFQNNKKWLWLTGGCFVAHPGGLSQNYRVEITDKQHFITQGVNDFVITTEQYYVLVDPAVSLLATSNFQKMDHPQAANPLPIKIPIAWTKKWGKGKVFYHSLGHDLEILSENQIALLTLQGFQWATRGNNFD